ncbi:hypothetical protein RvY_13185-2 [Ramazzottius varieornatus]|uniref:Uncharacterized protein n=1 Tax=Ramazzottius varieornatus TaxID=947166 RepID=A0A1D1VM28_RAMVA|nr:hypothetical protein RvY_13185-2 [Ramazzottius varieornatus]
MEVHIQRQRLWKEEYFGEDEITAYLRARGFERSLAQVTSKLKSLETSYRKAHDELVSQTGTGIDDLDERAKIDTVRKKLLTKCYLWDRLHPLNCDRPSMVPPAVMDNTDPIDENEDENGLPMEEDVETVNEDFGLDEVADDVMHHESTPEVEQPTQGTVNVTLTCIHYA